MNPEELRSNIRAAAVKFTEEVITIFGEAFAAVASDLSVGAKASTAISPAAAPARGRPAAAKKPVVAVPAPRAAAKESDKRNRRSTGELDKAGEQVVKLLQSKRTGMRVEEINRALGTSTRELMRPIQKLLNEGKIRKSGERRATTYAIA